MRSLKEDLIITRMAERTRLFIAEDDPTWSSLFGLLAEEGHEIAVQADSLTSALEGAQGLRGTKLDAAIVDSNLSYANIDGSDGRKIAGILRADFPGIRIIAVSNSESANHGDIFIKKGRTTMNEIRAVLDEIAPQQPRSVTNGWRLWPPRLFNK